MDGHINLRSVAYILFFFAAFASTKCTTDGYYVGFNFHLFSFYFGKHFRWEEFPDLNMTGSLWCPVIHLSIRGYAYRFMLYNFDELAELISHNTLIEPYIRQQFIDYVNARKQQSAIFKMLPTIIFYTAVFIFIVIVKYF
jgi:hypothetical protein